MATEYEPGRGPYGRDVPPTTRAESGAITERTTGARYTSEQAGAVTLPESLNITRDRVRWGPVLAGFLAALTTLIALSVLGLAVGLTAADTSPAAVANGTAAQNTGTFSAIWGAISGIIAFWLGGFTASKTSAVFARNWGTFNGMMVFFVAVPLTLWLAGMGLGAILGTLGGFTSALNIPLNQAVAAAQNPANQPTPAQIAAAAEATRNGAWTTLLGLGLALGAAAIGGAMGTRREVTSDDRPSTGATVH